MQKIATISQLSFVFTPDGFRPDVAEGGLAIESLEWKQKFEIDRFNALYQLGFAEMTDWFTPNPREIRFKCSCPDWAAMCKHVAAVLYGIGNRLDQDPFLFFAMRGINVSDFIQRSVEEKLSSMLRNADTKSPRVIEDQSLEELFGVL